MSDTGPGNVEFDLTTNLDEGSARAAGEALENALLKALEGIGAKIAKELTSSFKRASGSGGAMGGVDDQFKKMGDSAKRAGTETRATFNRLERDLEDLQAEARATEAAFRKLDFPPDLAKGLQVATRNITDLLERLRNDQKDFLNDPGLGDYYREEGLEARTAMRTAQTALRRTQESLSKERLAINRKEVATINADRSKLTAEMQQETTRIRAENKVRAAETRAHSERTNRIFKAAAKEFFTIQRAMGRTAALTARGIGTAFQGAARTVGTSFSRLGGIFRRQNREMTAGLDSALDRRETIMRSSFNKQESIVRNSVITQSRQIDRMERQVSKGVLGAATGRSALGGLLGGGLAIGGGLGLAAGFRRAIDLGGDFVQGLRVLDAQLGLTDKQMESIRQTSLDLGNDITLPGVSALDAAQAIQLLTKQFGAMGTNAAPAAEAAAKGVLALSRATSSSAEDAARVVGSAINIFGIEAGKAVQVADQVTGALSRAAGVGFDDFSRAFQQSATVFAQFQVPAVGAEEALVDFNTAIAVLARGGLIGSDAGTSLKQFFLQANRGTADSRAALHELTVRAGEVGTAFFDASGKARPLQEALGILRDGLKGLTDQERTATLQKIFGSDAIRAAEILTQTSQKTFDTIEKGVRRTGLAAEVAAAQNEGLKGAMDALGSVIDTQLILAYEKLQGAAGDVVLKLADFANKVFSAGGAFAVFRDAIKGVALGLGSLLAIKTVAEGFGLLKIAMRGLFTPLGLVALAFAGIGAAITVLSDISPEFKKMVDDIKANVGDLIDRGLDLAARGIENFGELLETTIIPAAKKVADFIGTNFLTGFRKAQQFITRTVIPKLKLFATFVTDTLIPAIRDFFVDAFETASDAVKNFWRVVEPVLRPAIRGIGLFAEAVEDLFKLKPGKGILAAGGVLAAVVAGFAVAGPLGAVVAGLGAAVAAVFATGLDDELGSALSGIGDTIVDVLGPQVAKVRDAVVGFFTAENLEGILRGFLDVVERVGFIIGNIVTDPRVLAVVAGLAALAVVIGARFIEGLGRGILDNVAEIGRILGPALKDALGEAIDFAVSDPLLFAGAIAAAIAAAAVASAVVSAWRNFGSKGAKTVSSAFATEMATAGRSSFVQGLFGSPAQINAALSKSSRQISTGLRREIGIMQAQLARGGRPVDVGSLVGLTPSALTAERNRLRGFVGQLERQVGPARAAGIRVRAAFTAAATDFRAASGAGKFAAGFSTLAAGLAPAAKQAGVSIGNTLALGIGSALTGFMSGKSGSTGFSIATILGAGAAGSVAGPWGAAFAAAAAAAGVFFGGLSAKHDKAISEANEYRDAIIEANNPELLNTTVGETFAQQLLDEGAGVQQFFLDTGADMEDLGRIISKEGADASQIFVGLAQAIGVSPEELEVLQEATKKGIDSLTDFENIEDLDFAKKMGLDDNEISAIMGVIKDEQGEVRKAFETAPTRNAILDMLNETAVGGKAGEDAIAGVKAVLAEVDAQAATTATGISEVFAKREAAAQTQLDNLKTKVDEAGAAADAAKEKLRKLIAGDFVDTTRESVDNLIQTIGGMSTANIGTGLVGEADVRDMMASINTQASTAFSTAIIEGSNKGLSQAKIDENLNRALQDGVQALKENPDFVTDDGTFNKLGTRAETALVNAFRRAKSQKVEPVIGEVKGLDQAWDRARGAFRRGAPKLQTEIAINARLKDIAATIASSIANTPEGPAKEAMRAKLEVLQGLIDGVSFDGTPIATAVSDAIKQGDFATPATDAATVFTDALDNFDFTTSGSGAATGVMTSFSDAIKQGDFETSATDAAERAATSFSDSIKQQDFAAAGTATAESYAGGVTTGAGFGEDAATALTEATAAAMIIGVIQAAFQGAATSESYAGGVESGTEAASAAAVGVTEATAAAMIVGVIQAAFQGVATGQSYASGVSSATGAASTAGSSVSSSAVSGASGHSLYQVGVDMAAGLAQGLYAGAAAVYIAAATIAARAAAILRSALQTGSPSRVTAKIGTDFAAGMAVGITEGISEVVAAATGMLNTTFAAMEDIIAKRGEIFESIFGGRAGKIDLQIGFEAGIDELVKEIKRLEDELAKQNAERAEKGLAPIERDFTRIDIGSEAGRRARELFNSAADAAKDILSSMIESGATTAQIRERFGNLREQLIASAKAAGFSAAQIRKLMRDAGLSAANIAKFLKKARDAERRQEGEAFTSRFQSLIEGVVSGIGKGKSLEEQFKLVRQGLIASGVDPAVIRKMSDDIRAALRQQRRDPSARIERYLERIARAQEKAAERAKAIARGGVLLPGLGKFQSEIEQFVENMRGVPFPQVRNQLVTMLRSIGVTVGPAQLKDLGEFIRHLRGDRVRRFADAVEEAAERMRAPQDFIDKFQSQFDRIIEEFSGNPAKIRDEINKALRHAGLGREAGKYAREINKYIRGVLDDPGRKLDEYLEKLLEAQAKEQETEYFAPVMNIYPPSGDPHAQALVLLNRLAAERPRGY